MDKNGLNTLEKLNSYFKEKKNDIVSEHYNDFKKKLFFIS